MKFEEITAIVGKVPFISKGNAEFLYNLIMREKLTRILELGIGHGTATCYMAAALQELGEGKITAVDLIEVKEQFKPSAEAQLAATGLEKYADIVRMQSGYTWFLHDEIRKNTENNNCHEVYDLCIIDGPKNWTIDGAAFFFADKLLKTNGWIIFDDYRWTYAEAQSRRDATDGITHRSLSKEERETPQIKEVFELLVKQHPHYSTPLRLDDGNWAIAQKTARDEKTYKITYRYEDSYKDIIAKGFHKFRRVLRKIVKI